MPQRTKGNDEYCRWFCEHFTQHESLFAQWWRMGCAASVKGNKYESKDDVKAVRRLAVYTADIASSSECRNMPTSAIANSIFLCVVVGGWVGGGGWGLSILSICSHAYIKAKSRKISRSALTPPARARAHQRPLPLQRRVRCLFGRSGKPASVRAR